MRPPLNFSFFFYLHVLRVASYANVLERLRYEDCVTSQKNVSVGGYLESGPVQKFFSSVKNWELHGFPPSIYSVKKPWK